MRLDLMRGVITLDGKILTKQQLITITGYTGLLYHEGSLFCLTAEALPNISEEDLEIFLDYTEEDWEYMGEYVAELYEKEDFLVDCRQN